MKIGYASLVLLAALWLVPGNEVLAKQEGGGKGHGHGHDKAAHEGKHKGWDKGKKKGWHGEKMPPGQMKKHENGDKEKKA